jgi:hypothetical protein
MAKHPKNAYVCWLDENRTRLMEEAHSAGEKSYTERAGTEWKRVSGLDKSRWQLLSEIDQARYKAELEQAKKERGKKA